MIQSTLLRQPSSRAEECSLDHVARVTGIGRGLAGDSRCAEGTAFEVVVVGLLVGRFLRELFCAPQRQVIISADHAPRPHGGSSHTARRWLFWGPAILRPYAFGSDSIRASRGPPETPGGNGRCQRSYSDRDGASLPNAHLRGRCKSLRLSYRSSCSRPCWCDRGLIAGSPRDSPLRLHDSSFF